jgi:hypothetical protein
MMHSFVEKLWKFHHCSPWWHKQQEVGNYLHASLPQRWIGRTTDDMSLTRWPPWNPNLRPCDLLLRGYVRDNVFIPPVLVTVDDLKQCFTTATAGVDEDILTCVCQEFDYRVDICCVTKGVHRASVSCCNKLPEFLYKTVHCECQYLK